MKITRIAAVGLIAATVSVAGFAGCGGSDSSSSAPADTAAAVDTTATSAAMTKEEFVAAANKICTDVNAKESEIKAKLDATNLQSVQDTLSSALDESKAAMAQIEALTPPEELSATFQTYVDNLKAVAANAESVVSDITSATAVEDAVAAASANAAQAEQLSTDAHKVATELGLTDCAKG